MNSNFRRLKIPSKFSNHRSLLCFSRRKFRLEKSIESMIQFQSDPLDMIEVRISRLENMHRNKITLPIQSLTIPNTSSHIDENQESWYLEDFDQDSVSPQSLNLTNINPLTSWQVFILMRLKLIMNVNPIPNFVIRFPSLNLC